MPERKLYLDDEVQIIEDIASGKRKLNRGHSVEAKALEDRNPFKNVDEQEAIMFLVSGGIDLDAYTEDDVQELVTSTLILLGYGLDISSVPIDDLNQLADSVRLLVANEIRVKTVPVNSIIELAKSMRIAAAKDAGLDQGPEMEATNERQELGTRMTIIKQAYDSGDLVFDRDSLDKLEDAVREYASEKGFSLKFNDFDVMDFINEVRSSLKE